MLRRGLVQGKAGGFLLSIVLGRVAVGVPVEKLTCSLCSQEVLGSSPATFNVPIL